MELVLFILQISGKINVRNVLELLIKKINCGGIPKNWNYSIYREGIWIIGIRRKDRFLFGEIFFALECLPDCN